MKIKKEKLVQLVDSLLWFGTFMSIFFIVTGDFQSLVIHLIFGFFGAMMVVSAENGRYQSRIPFVLRCTLSGVPTFVSVLMVNCLTVVPEKPLDNMGKKSENCSIKL